MKKILFMAICLSFGVFHTQAQDVIIPKQGNPITVYNLEVTSNFYIYTLDENSESTMLRIAKDSVLMVRKADGSVLSTEKAATNVSSNKNTDYPIIKDEDIHGSLIAKGNKVFIPTDSPLSYERAGQKELKKLVEKWGYWTVVEDVEQAHFVLQFTTVTTGYDFSILGIRPRKYYRDLPLPTGSMQKVLFNKKYGIGAIGCYSNDSDNANIVLANRMCGLFTKIVTEPDSNIGKQFYTKRMKKVIDADAKSNNFAGGNSLVAIVMINPIKNRDL